MVKRPKSPDIVEDSRLFTVYQPYPLNANWVFEDNQKQCALWVAECIGSSHLWVIYQKPKARGMILLEISKRFTDHGRLLGEHRWSEFLKEAGDEEEERITQVFHSFYAKVRDAQKDGWKAMTVKSDWFKDWAPGQGEIRKPYPPTHWCPVPVEDRTNKPLCRPLPVEQKPPPPRAQAPVVGSSKWVEKQVEGAPTPATLTSAWFRKVHPLDTDLKANETPSNGVKSPNALSPQSVTSGQFPTPQSAKSRSRVPTTPASATSQVPLAAPAASSGGGKNGWSKPIPLQKFNSTDTNSPKSKPVWGQPVQKSASAAGAKSPLAEPAPTGPINAWSKPLKITPVNTPKSRHVSIPNSPPNRPVELFGEPSIEAWFDAPSADKGKGRASSTPGSNNSPWGTRPPSPGKPQQKVPKAPEAPKQKQLSSTAKADKSKKRAPAKPAIEEPVYVEVPGGLPEIEGQAEVEQTAEDMEIAHIAPWESGTAGGSLDWGSAAVDYGEWAAPQPANEGNQVQWDNLWEEDETKKKKPELICPTHNIACKKGICRDMAKMIKQQEYKEKEREREEAMKARRGRSRGGARGRGHRGNQDNGSGSSGDNNADNTNNEAETDNDGFTTGRPRTGGRGGRGRGNGNSRGGKRDDAGPSYIGRLRGFEEKNGGDNNSNDDGDADAASTVADSQNGWANSWD